MKGYKIFIKPYKGNDWEGPHFFCPEGWKIRAGDILEAAVNMAKWMSCARGVNFYRTKTIAQDEFRFEKKHNYDVCMYEIKTLGTVVKPHGIKRKARTNKLKLIRRVTNV